MSGFTIERVETFRFRTQTRLLCAAVPYLCLFLVVAGLLSDRLLSYDPLAPFGRWCPPVGWSLVAVLFLIGRPFYLAEFVVDDTGIRRRGRGRRALSLRWEEISEIKDRPFHNRIELRAVDGKVLRLPTYIESFARLRTLILAKTNWREILATQGSTRGSPALPATFYLSGIAPIIQLSSSALCWFGVVMLAWAAVHLFGRGQSFWAYVVAALGLAFAAVGARLLDFWVAVRVDRDFITLRGTFRRKAIPVPALSGVRIEDRVVPILDTGKDARIQFVTFVLRSGQSYSVSSVRDGCRALYNAVLCARERLHPQEGSDRNGSCPCSFSREAALRQPLTGAPVGPGESGVTIAGADREPNDAVACGGAIAREKQDDSAGTA